MIKDQQKQKEASPVRAPGEDVLAANAQAPLKQSWGEKYGAGTFGFLRDWVINYFINFTIGAVTAYKFETSNFGKNIDTKLDNFAKKLTFLPYKTAQFVVKFPTRNQFLLAGGHALLPVLKVMKDNQQKLTFGIGHTLDQLQEFTGNGNEDSKRALAEYGRTKQLLDGKKNGATAALTDDDKSMLARKHIDEKLEFKEYHQSWWSVIKARLIAMACSTTASMGLGWMSGQTYLPKVLQFRPEVEQPFGRWAAKNIITKTPGLRGYFKENPSLIGQYFLDDAVLTVVSAGVYRAVEKADEDKAKQEMDKADKPTHKVSAIAQQGTAAERSGVSLNNA